jgi:hypothetical protein
MIVVVWALLALHPSPIWEASRRCSYATVRKFPPFNFSFLKKLEQVQNANYIVQLIFLKSEIFEIRAY